MHSVDLLGLSASVSYWVLQPASYTLLVTWLLLMYTDAGFAVQKVELRHSILLVQSTHILAPEASETFSGAQRQETKDKAPTENTDGMHNSAIVPHSFLVLALGCCSSAASL